MGRLIFKALSPLPDGKQRASGFFLIAPTLPRVLDGSPSRRRGPGRRVVVTVELQNQLLRRI